MLFYSTVAIHDRHNQAIVSIRYQFGKLYNVMTSSLEEQLTFGTVP